MLQLKGRRILVTGSAGCVGANLIRRLLDHGAELHAVMRRTTDPWRLEGVLSRLSVHLADLTDIRAVTVVVRNVDPDAIFHCAVERSSNFAALVGGNLLATSNLLEASAGRSDLKFVHLGSSLEYGRKRGAMHESAALQPRTAFGVTKAAGSLLAQQTALANGRFVVVLRLFHVYGPYEAPKRLVPSAIRAAMNGTELPLTGPGYRHDYIYVGDVVDVCLRALEAPNAAGEIINIGSGRDTTNEKLVDLVGQTVGRPIQTRPGAYPARAVDTQRWVADNRKAKMLLDWKPKHSLREGIRETLSWMLDNASANEPAIERI